VRACHTLGIERVPVLYVSRDCEWPAVAHSASSRRPVVVLNARLIDHGWREEMECLTFVMAGAVGSLRLGHTLWWVELRSKLEWRSTNEKGRRPP
jgi:hypothetical protein